MVFVWTFKDVIFILMVIIVLIFLLMNWLETAMCPHDAGVTETGSCDAICKKCGKNLGFIGKWREENKDWNIKNDK